jgi:nucleotide-binding universal stress UspA family protein
MVPLDGSPDAEGVLASARDLAETVSTELLLVRAVRTSTPDPYRPTAAGQAGLTPASSRSMTEARQYLETVASTKGVAFASVDILVAPGEPACVVADAAHDEDADLVAMAPQGGSCSGRHTLDGATDAVLQRVHLPVLLAPCTALASQSVERLAAAARR